MSSLSHTDSDGKAKMVDVGAKRVTSRSAVASVEVVLNDDAYSAARENRSAKGDVLAAAKLAGIMAAKKTSDLIPLCHPLPLDVVEISFSFDDSAKTIKIRSSVSCQARTGAEMEALTACSVSALTIYDMLKAIQKNIVITNLVLLKKSGGRSGEYCRENS